MNTRADLICRIREWLGEAATEHHAEFTFWYLRACGFIEWSDADGFSLAESVDILGAYELASFARIALDAARASPACGGAA
jgi:hypothetical protein